MPEVLSIVPEGDGVLEHLKGILAPAKLTHVIALTAGMASGMPSVAFVVETLDGKTAFLGETSMRLFLDAADIFKKVHGDPRADGQTGSGSA